MLYSIFPENVSSRPRMGGLDFGTPCTSQLGYDNKNSQNILCYTLGNNKIKFSNKLTGKRINLASETILSEIYPGLIR